MFDAGLGGGSLLVLCGLLLAAGFGAPMPEEPLLLAAGVAAHRTPVPWWLALVAVYVAALGADALVFGFARHLGEPLLRHWPLRVLVTPVRRERVRALLHRHGARAVLFGRHVMGLRTLVFIFAGIEHMPLRRFLLWDALAALLSVPTLFGLGYLFSSHVAKVESGIATTQHWLLVGLGGGALVAWLVWSRPRLGGRGGHGPRG